MSGLDLNAWELFLKGGGIMWPLLFLSIVSWIIIIERGIYFSRRGYRFMQSLEVGLGEMSSPEIVNPIVKVVSAYREGVVKGEEHSFNVGAREASRVVTQHERGLKTLATIGMASPLIGLLGTVWGMVQAFAQIAALGEQVSPADFADGIWGGLLTTVAGLLVAIPAVVASRMYEAKVIKLSQDLNELASHLKERYFPSESV